VTCARGSSAHAATFGKHLIERYLGIPVAAAAPNIASVYRSDSQARIILGGRLGFMGRYPGIAEEALETIRSGAALYIIGGFGGASRAVCYCSPGVRRGTRHRMA
jgi:glutamine---fructose-6-phosphate transaminase (isomerizing)